MVIGNLLGGQNQITMTQNGDINEFEPDSLSFDPKLPTPKATPMENEINSLNSPMDPASMDDSTPST